MTHPLNSSVKACIFDLDGTLVDSAPGISLALELAFRESGRDVSAVDFRRLIGPPIRTIARQVFPDMSDEEVGALESAFRLHYDEDTWRETSMFDGVCQTLEEFEKDGMRLFIATNKPLLPTTRILKHLGLSEIFEAVMTRDSVVPHLPDKAAMLNYLIDHHHLRSETTIMIGDTAEDGEAALANQIGFVFMKYGYGDLPKAEWICDNFGDLHSMFQAKSHATG